METMIHNRNTKENVNENFCNTSQTALLINNFEPSNIRKLTKENSMFLKYFVKSKSLKVKRPAECEDVDSETEVGQAADEFLPAESASTARCLPVSMVNIVHKPRKNPAIIFREKKLRTLFAKLWECDLFENIVEFLDVEDCLSLTTPGFFSLHYGSAIQRAIRNHVSLGLSTAKRNIYWRSKFMPVPGYYQKLLKQTYSQEVAIEQDIERTFPNLGFFDKGEEGYLKLFRVLKALALHFKQVGYCQGLNFLGALVLMHLGEEEASFWMLVRILNTENYLRIYYSGMNEFQEACFQLEALVKKHLPRLYNFFSIHSMDANFYASQWFFSVLCYDLPIEISYKVIDFFLLDGWKMIYRVMLALLQRAETSILRHHSFEHSVIYLKNFMKDECIDEYKLFQEAFKFKVTRKQLSRLSAVYSHQIKAKKEEEARVARSRSMTVSRNAYNSSRVLPSMSRKVLSTTYMNTVERFYYF